MQNGLPLGYNSTLDSIEDSIFLTIGAKALELNAINLSQGFPDFSFQEEILEKIAQSARKAPQQYAPPRGYLPLRENLSRMIEKVYGSFFDPKEEILLTAGATQGIFITIMALVDTQDKVLIFAPFYDSYLASIHLAKGVPVEFPLELNSPSPINFEKLEEYLQIHRPKMMIFNHPHNPSGLCFEKAELMILLELAHRYNCYLLSDEVYEFLTFEGRKHTPFFTLDSPIAKSRKNLITISSAGKTFGYTGHKLGWILAHGETIQRILKVHQYNVFSINTPFQWAYAQIFEDIPAFETYIQKFQALYEEKRNFFYEGLKKRGWNVLKPQGTYFMLAEIPSSFSQDYSFCLHLLEKRRLASIPVSSFFKNKEEGKAQTQYLRFCFAKGNSVLEKGLECLGSPSEFPIFS